MDDPGSLIYIAFLVVSLIAGLINNRKKKQQEQASNPQPTAQGQRIDRSEIDRLVEEERKANEAAARLLESLSYKESKEKEQPKKDRKVEPLEEEEIEESSYADSILDLSEGFDARKAIIYSEILNPPHL